MGVLQQLSYKAPVLLGTRRKEERRGRVPKGGVGGLGRSGGGTRDAQHEYRTAVLIGKKNDYSTNISNNWLDELD
jgi:hypothetical protein